ncbi:hypothetical protein GOP47_0012765 [Adiantum capillus-veneris]|uniref:EF-hand domain-containing protein n=1 Tax=Adiantum capillus-veneris TaxID=13818 RepID=A0A9D4URR0_ADICA|nr:hypothetical protein GOP47_0012765 [Adiantum capillus-veneris]
MEAFQDYLPLMAERLGERGLMQELEKGFHLLADPSSHTITLQSLKQNAPLLGMPPMSDSELREIICLGDSRGRGELDLHEFCVTMVRTSPALMDQALATLFCDASSDEDDEDGDDGNQEEDMEDAASS